MVRSAAWSIPVVAVAATAPAYASSRCADGVFEVRWADMSNSTKITTAVRTSTSGTGAIGTSAVTVTVTNSFGGSMIAGSAPDGASNMTASPFNVGATGARGLTMMQRAQGTSFSGTRSGHFQTFTLKFNRAVWGLKYTVTDIDSSNGQYQDRIFVSGAPAVTKYADVIGGGTSTDPFAPRVLDRNQNPQTDDEGNATVDYGTYSGDTYTITYWNDQSGNLSSNGLQGVFISGLSFSSETCTP